MTTAVESIARAGRRHGWLIERRTCEMQLTRFDPYERYDVLLGPTQVVTGVMHYRGTDNKGAHRLVDLLGARRPHKLEWLLAQLARPVSR